MAEQTIPVESKAETEAATLHHISDNQIDAIFGYLWQNHANFVRCSKRFKAIAENVTKRCAEMNCWSQEIGFLGGISLKNCMFSIKLPCGSLDCESSGYLFDTCTVESGPNRNSIIITTVDPMFQFPPLPVDCYQEHGLTSLGDHIYMTGDCDSQIIDLHRYNLLSKTWETLPTPPESCFNKYWGGLQTLHKQLCTISVSLSNSADHHPKLLYYLEVEDQYTEENEADMLLPCQHMLWEIDPITLKWTLLWQYDKALGYNRSVVPGLNLGSGIDGGDHKMIASGNCIYVIIKGKRAVLRFTPGDTGDTFAEPKDPCHSILIPSKGKCIKPFIQGLFPNWDSSSYCRVSIQRSKGTVTENVSSNDIVNIKATIGPTGILTQSLPGQKSQNGDCLFDLNGHLLVLGGSPACRFLKVLNTESNIWYDVFNQDNTPINIPLLTGYDPAVVYDNNKLAVFYSDRNSKQPMIKIYELVFDSPKLNNHYISNQKTLHMTGDLDISWSNPILLLRPTIPYTSLTKYSERLNNLTNKERDAVVSKTKTKSNTTNKKDSSQASLYPSMPKRSLGKQAIGRQARHFWLTMEHSFRASSKGREDFNIEINMTKQIVPTLQQMSAMGIGWCSTGLWSERNKWSDLEWYRFTKFMKGFIEFTFPFELMTLNEKELVAAYMISYGPRHQSGVPSKEVDLLLKRMKSLNGNPLKTCAACNAFASGSKMLCCSQCKSVFYCNKICQSKGWKNDKHSKFCIPCDTDPRKIPGQFLWTKPIKMA